LIADPEGVLVRNRFHKQYAIPWSTIKGFSVSQNGPHNRYSSTVPQLTIIRTDGDPVKVEAGFGKWEAAFPPGMAAELESLRTGNSPEGADVPPGRQGRGPMSRRLLLRLLLGLGAVAAITAARTGCSSGPTATANDKLACAQVNLIFKGNGTPTLQHQQAIIDLGEKADNAALRDAARRFHHSDVVGDATFMTEAVDDMVAACQKMHIGPP
jgi:hypothetical protein